MSQRNGGRNTSYRIELSKQFSLDSGVRSYHVSMKEIEKKISKTSSKAYRRLNIYLKNRKTEKGRKTYENEGRASDKKD